MSVLHRAENVVNTIEDNTLIYTMERPDEGGRRLEGIENSGDSGSPAQIRNPDTGRWNIDGVKSRVWALTETLLTDTPDLAELRAIGSLLHFHCCMKRVS